MFKRKLSRAEYALLAANLIPVAGVWFLGWNPKEMFVVYALETVIAGLFTLLKMGITTMVKKQDDWHGTGGSKKKMPGWFFMVFFIFHYGMFVAIQMGMFLAVSGMGNDTGFGLFSFFNKIPELLTTENLWVLAAFVLSYILHNLSGFILTGEYKTASLSYLMFQPYARIFVQQFTVIAGSIFISFGAGKIFILIFAGVKIFMELFVDYDSIIRKAAKGELPLSRKQ